MTLRFKNRIALYNTLAMAITTAMVFIVVYFVVYKTSYDHLDNDILTEKEEVFSNLYFQQDSVVINRMPEWDEAEHNQVEVSPTFLQIIDAKGKVIFHSANLLKDRFAYNPGVKDAVFYNGEINGQRIRLGQFPVTNESGIVIAQLTIAVSQQESYVILNHLLLVLLISFPFLLMVQFVASSLAASKSIRPVHQLIKIASGIGYSNIATRLVLPEHRDELYDLTITINELLSRIESSILQQRQFTGDASHEIRTPLAAIRGTLEVMLRKPREPKVYEAKATEIIAQVDRLDALLEQLLQLARIDSGVAVAKNERVNLAEMVAALENKWQLIAANLQINLFFQVSQPAFVTGDRVFIEIMVDNIVGNALKYSKPGGSVVVLWNDDTRILSIEDDGIGISSESLPFLFNRFFRADESRSSSVSGNGLGLSIVKKLADIQGISLRVESNPGTGSIFFLQFPV